MIRKYIFGLFALLCCFNIASGAVTVVQTNGAIVGPLSARGLTNSNPDNYSLNTNHLSNALWLQNKANSLDDNTNFLRYQWRRSLSTLIKQRRPLKIQIEGTGFVDLGILNSVWENITNDYPVVGTMTAYFPYVYDGPNSGTSANLEFLLGKNAYWYSAYSQTTNSSGIDEISISIPWNIIKIFYVKAPDGGSFKIQTNRNSGTWNDLAGYTAISSANGSITGGTIIWTNPAGINSSTGIRVVATAAGTNRIVSEAAENSSSTRGLIIGRFSNSSALIEQEVAITNSAYNIYSNMSPDLVIWQSISTTNDIGTYLPKLVDFYQKAVFPSPDIVLCGVYVAWAQTNTDNTKIPDQNRFIRQAAVTYNVSYFDGNTPFESITNVSSRGYLSGDGTHYSTEGFYAYGYLLTRWLDLRSGADLFSNWATKRTEYTMASTTTLVGDPEMVVRGLKANRLYNAKIKLVFRSAADTTGWQWGLSCPTLSLFTINYHQTANNGAGLGYNNILGEVTTSGSVAIGAANTSLGYNTADVMIDVLFQPAEDGTMQVYWGPFASVSDTLTLKAGSYIRIEPVGDF